MQRRSKKYDPTKCPVCRATLVTLRNGDNRCPRCAQSRIDTCERFGLKVRPEDRRIVAAATSTTTKKGS